MNMYDIVIIGGGPAGLAAAASAKDYGADSILILERDCELGGILNQCIHNGFGLHTFKEELTGPEYAARYVTLIKELQIPYMLNTMVIDISAPCQDDPDSSRCDASDRIRVSPVRKITAINRTDGLFEIRAKAVILAMGCRERSRGALNIPGYRPAGIFSAGTAQRLVNLEGYLPGHEAVILGSGDIGLIMARRLTLEGAKVKAVAEIMPYSSGLKRNVVQCLDDYGIPLKLNHTVIEIRGKERVEGVTIARVDEYRKPVPGTEEYYSCDTLLLSVGLIPENELTEKLGIRLNPVTHGPFVNESLETDSPGIFACGNVLHVHDLVDHVSEESSVAGKCAAHYIRHIGASSDGYAPCISVRFSDGIRYTVPSVIHPARTDQFLTLRFRVDRVFRNCRIALYSGEHRIFQKKRPVMSPGEMEEIRISKQKFMQCSVHKEITLKIEHI